MADIQTMLKETVEEVKGYVADAATLTVETRWVGIEAGATPNFDTAKPVARTIIKLDGDCAAIVPVRQGSTGNLEIDAELFELHQQSVNTAIEYRARMLNIMLGALKSLTE